MAVTSIQDFKNQADSANLGTKTGLETILANVIALKALITAGGTPPADQLALLDAVLGDAQALTGQAANVVSESTPPAP